MSTKTGALSALLTLSLILFIAPLILVIFDSLLLPEHLVNLALLLAVTSGFLYLLFLGMLAARKGRSVIKWVGLTFIFSPLGHVISYPLMLAAKPLERCDH